MSNRPRTFRISLSHAFRLLMRGWEIVELEPPAAGCCYLVAPTGHKFSIRMQGENWWAEMIPFTG